MENNKRTRKITDKSEKVAEEIRALLRKNKRKLCTGADNEIRVCTDDFSAFSDIIDL